MPPSFLGNRKIQDVQAMPENRMIRRTKRSGPIRVDPVTTENIALRLALIFIGLTLVGMAVQSCR